MTTVYSFPLNNCIQQSLIQLLPIIQNNSGSEVEHLQGERGSADDASSLAAAAADRSDTPGISAATNQSTALSSPLLSQQQHKSDG